MQDRSSPIDRYTIVPFLGCVYSLIVYPMLFIGCGTFDLECTLAPRPENKIVWPLLAGTAIILLIVSRRHASLARSPNVMLLACYIGLAGASTLWAFNPSLSTIRFAQQAMVVMSIVPIVAVAPRSSDALRALFLCFALSIVLNALFVNIKPPITHEFATWGYPGYFLGKNYLGECAGFALIMAAYEVSHRGGRRALGAAVAVLAVPLLLLSNSKTSIALVVLAPSLAFAAVMARRKLSISPVALPAAIVAIYVFLSSISNFSIYRLSYMIYGDSSFTGRTVIWDFAVSEIAKRPWLGWGYQSFWLAGIDAPSYVDGPGWVKFMPHSHNGYIDARVELGNIGFLLLILFIAATLHSARKVIDREPGRAWVLLSLAFFVMITNGLESTWARGFEFPWIVFLFVTAEIARVSARTTEVGSASKQLMPAGLRGLIGGNGRFAIRPAMPAERARDDMLLGLRPVAAHAVESGRRSLRPRSGRPGTPLSRRRRT